VVGRVLVAGRWHGVLRESADAGELLKFQIPMIKFQ